MGWVVNATLRPLYPRERDPVPLYRRLSGPHGRSGRVRKISLLPGFDPRTVQPVSSRYTDCAIPATNHYGSVLKCTHTCTKTMMKKKNTEYITCRGSACGTGEHKENGDPTAVLDPLPFRVPSPLSMLFVVLVTENSFCSFARQTSRYIMSSGWKRLI
jgi:hypothetical protein